MIPNKVYSPEEILRAAARRKWLIAISCVLVTLGTAAVSLVMPERFRSHALIQVLPLGINDNYVRSTVQARMEENLSAINQQILTRTNLEPIIKNLDLYSKLRQATAMEKVVERMRRDISFGVIDREVLRIGYEAGDPHTALTVTQRLTSLFIESSARDRAGLAAATKDLIEGQLEDTRRRLDERQKKVDEYRQRYAGQLPSQLPANLQVLNSTQTQLQALVESLNRDRDQRLVFDRRRDQIAAEDPIAVAAPANQIPSADPTAPEGASAAEQLESARQALRAMELRLTPEHPDIIRTKRTIERLEAKVAAEARDSRSRPGTRPKTAAEAQRQSRLMDIDSQIELLDRQIATKQAEDRRLRGMLTEYRDRVEAAPSRESELATLTRDHETLQKLYSDLLGKKEDAKMAANLEQREAGERFRVIDPARLPEKRFKPARTRMTLIGMLAGLALGLGLTALLEYRDSSLRTDDDVTSSLGLPVLAMIPVFPGSERRPTDARRWF